MEVSGQVKVPAYYIHGQKPQHSGVGGWWGINAALDSLEKRQTVPLPGL